tara:strand:+ start:1970 stop:2437 length:468 start_codon:yes stop_codon:yes gene_type:complete
MGLTNIGEQVVLNRIFGGIATGTINAELDGNQVYKLALYTAVADAENFSGTECGGSAGGGTAYEAQVINFGSLTEATATATNSTDLESTVTFTSDAGSDWGTITDYGIHVVAGSGTSVSNGTCIFTGTWDSSAVVNTGDTVQVVAGPTGLVITVT